MSNLPKTTIFALFLKEMDEIGHASPHTLKAYHRDLNQAFAESLEAPLPDDKALLRILKEAQIRWGKLELSSRQRKTATLKSFLNYLYQKKMISSPLADQLEAPKVPRKLPNYLSVDEALELLKHLNNQDQTNSLWQRKAALTFLLYGGGLRVSEACQLRWDGVRLSSSEIRVMGKGAKERWVVVPPSVTEKLKNLSKQGIFIWGDSPLVERTAFEWIRQLGREIKLLRPLHPHALRHSYATHLVSSGMNLRTLQELMGHASLVSTEKYLHLSIDQLARTMQRNHPLGKNAKNSEPQ